MVNCNAVKLIKYSDHKQKDSFDNKGFSMAHTACISLCKKDNVLCISIPNKGVWGGLM